MEQNTNQLGHCYPILTQLPLTLKHHPNSKPRPRPKLHPNHFPWKTHYLHDSRKVSDTPPVTISVKTSFSLLFPLCCHIGQCFNVQLGLPMVHLVGLFLASSIDPQVVLYYHIKIPSNIHQQNLIFDFPISNYDHL
jgi:hypothetical protein